MRTFIIEFINLFVICAHSFNIIQLTLLWHFAMAFLFPIGIVCAVVLSIDVISKLSGPKTVSRRALFLAPCLLLAGIVLVFVIGNGSMVPVIFIVLFTPVLVMSGPTIACIALLRLGVPKVCAVLLIASLALAIAAAPIAQAIGSENKIDEIILLLHPEILCWVACVASSTFLCGGGKNGIIDNSAEAATVVELPPKTELLLAGLL